MSRHQAYRNYDYQNDLDAYEDDEGADAEEDELSHEDKVAMATGTRETRAALGPQSSKVTDKQIQDALWHYYYDVDKTVAYLVGKFIEPGPKQEAAAPKKAKTNGTESTSRLAFLASVVFEGGEGEEEAYMGRPRHKIAKRSVEEDFWHDMPWQQIPVARQTSLFEPPRTRGGLLGGSSKPKMSKLQALAAARKAKASESASESSPAAVTATHKMRKLSLGDASTTRPGSAEPAEDSSKRRKLEAAVKPAATSILQDAPQTLEKLSQAGVSPSAQSLHPSAFASALFDSAAGAALAVPAERVPLIPLPRRTAVEEAFLVPSPDDVVLAAQSQAPKLAQKTAIPKKNGVSGLENGVNGLKVSDSPLPKSKNLDVLDHFEKSKKKAMASFVVAGHVDAGKSTMMGRLLLDLNVVDQRTIDKYRKEAETMGKASFALAWVLDSGSEERSRGVTMDIATNHFETDTTSFTVLDAPGHRDFIPNMIAGASQADFAVLVVDAATGAFEAGLKGQTKEHALLIRSMGVSRVIVAVNKLDTAQWDQGRFGEISQQTAGFLKATGFQPKNISFVPLSGLHGDNVVKRSEDPRLAWYQGGTLIEELERSEPTQRALQAPLRLTISELEKTTLGALTIHGRLDAGSLQVGDALLIQPSGERPYVKALESEQEPVDWAVAGQKITIHLSNVDPMHVRVGDVVCSPSANPIKCIDSFTVKALAFEILLPSQVDVHRGRMHETGEMVEFVALLDKTTGAVLKKKPRIVKPGTVARIHVKMQKKVPLESGQRVVLRGGGQTLAAGLLE